MPSLPPMIEAVDRKAPTTNIRPRQGRKNVDLAPYRVGEKVCLRKERRLEIKEGGEVAAQNAQLATGSDTKPPRIILERRKNGEGSTELDSDGV